MPKMRSQTVGPTIVVGSNPGERESLQHSPKNDAGIPWLQWRMQLGASAIGLVVLYLAFLGIVWWILAYKLTHGYPRLDLGLAVWRGLLHMGGIALRSVIVPFILWAIVCTIVTKHLVWDRLRPVILSPGWPPASGPADPSRSAQTYRESRDDMYPEEEDDDEPERPPTIKVQITNGKATKLLDLPNLPTMPGFLADIAKDDKLFSVRNAARYQISRQQFEDNVRDELIRAGLAYWANPKRVKLRAAGKAVCLKVAEAWDKR